MRQVLLLAAAIAVGQFANSMVLPALPLIARELGASPGRAGLVVTIYFAGFALVGLFVGPLSDRIGRRALLVGGLLVLACGSVACAFASGFAMLLACRALEAAGAAGSPVLARAIVRDTREGPELAAALGLLATIMSASPVVGPILGGFIAELLGWRWLFAILSVATVLVAVAIWLGIDETLTPAVAQAGQSIRQQMLRLWSLKRFRRGVLFASPFYFAFGALYTSAPFVLIDRFGLGHGQFGLAFGLISLCLATAGVIGPKQLPTLGLRTLLYRATAGFLLAGVLLVGLAALHLDNAVTFIACLALFGLAFGVALSLGSAMTLGDVGAAAGAASSLSGFLQIGSAAVGSALAGLLHTGSAMPIGAFFAIGAVAAFLAIRDIEDAPAKQPSA